MEDIQTSFITKGKLPLVIEPKSKFSYARFLDHLKGNREFVKLKLLKYGGILFRGFPVEGAESFHKVVEALDLGKPLNYIGGDTPRDKISDKIYTATEAPPSFKILLHNEMSFIQNYPRHIYFHCDTPAQTGGATILADAREVYQAIDKEIKEPFMEKGLRYVSNFYAKSWLLDLINRYKRAHKTWMDAFETKDKKEVEKRCLENEFKFQWMKKDWLQVIYDCPATREHPITKEKVWFNQAHLYDYNWKHIGFWNWLGCQLVYFRKHTVMHEIYYGDGAKISRKSLYKVMKILDEKTLEYPWQKGDVLVLDNILAMHGRSRFTGKRRILAAMTR